MRVLVYEDNLIWSLRLVKSLAALGHEALLRTAPVAESADVAIVNLASPKLEPARLVAELASLGTRVIGHAGHKEKDLLQLGRDAGCHLLATNGELTFKIEGLLERVTGNG